MTNQQPPELFPSERPTTSIPPRPKSYVIRRLLTVLIALGLIGGGVYEIYLWKRTPGTIPTIHAEASLKQKPESPGGIDIPNQDVMAYQQIDGGEGKAPAAEHMLPAAETPQPGAATAPVKESAITATPPGTPSIENLVAPSTQQIVTTVATPKATPTPAVDEPVSGASSAYPSQPAEKTASAEPAPSPEAKAPASNVAIQKSAKPETTPAPEEQAAVPAAQPEKAATAKTQSVGKGNYRVQVASYPDRDQASHELSKLQSKYQPHLNGASLHLEKADLGSRGIYYRVQSSAMSAGDAKGVCSALKNIKAGCIVVKP